MRGAGPPGRGASLGCPRRSAAAPPAFRAVCAPTAGAAAGGDPNSSVFHSRGAPGHRAGCRWVLPPSLLRSSVWPRRRAGLGREAMAWGRGVCQPGLLMCGISLFLSTSLSRSLLSPPPPSIPFKIFDSAEKFRFFLARRLLLFDGALFCCFFPCQVGILVETVNCRDEFSAAQTDL
ncbi:hypothetical protein Nmel_003197 [Mimus melanotis]